MPAAVESSLLQGRPGRWKAGGGGEGCVDPATACCGRQAKPYARRRASSIGAQNPRGLAQPASGQRQPHSRPRLASPSPFPLSLPTTPTHQSWSLAGSPGGQSVQSPAGRVRGWTCDRRAVSPRAWRRTAPRRRCNAARAGCARWWRTCFPAAAPCVGIAWRAHAVGVVLWVWGGGAPLPAGRSTRRGGEVRGSRQDWRAAHPTSPPPSPNPAPATGTDPPLPPPTPAPRAHPNGSSICTPISSMPSMR